MAEFGGALDTWLEAPYVQRAQDEADYEQWCEQQGVDPADDHWQEFEDFKAQFDYYGPTDDPEDEKEWRDECDRAEDERNQS